MADLDPRLLEVIITVGNKVRTYAGDFTMEIQGTKFISPNQGNCTIRLTNLKKTIRDQILTETSPFNANRILKRIDVKAGRISTGKTLVYTGNVYKSIISQSPDQTVTLNCLTRQFEKKNIVERSFEGSISLKAIAQQVATDIGSKLIFEATDQNIADYSFTGSATKQIDKLAQVKDINVFIDNDTLVIKDEGKPLNIERIISPESGMIGLPQPTELGLRITMLFDNNTQIGSRLSVTSHIYPSYSGDYEIYKLNYHLTNRDIPFYLIADTRRITHA